MNMEIRRGDIFIAKLEAKGSVQGGERPVIVWSNNLNNKHCPTINIIPISTRIGKNLPMHVKLIKGGKTGLNEDSIALLEQIQTINKSQLFFKENDEDKLKKIGYVDSIIIRELEKAASLQQGMTRPVSISKINNLLDLINESIEMYNETNNEFFKRNMNTLKLELEQYCDSYNISLEMVINKRKINEIVFTKNGAVING